MVPYCKPKNLKDLVIPSKMEIFKERDVKSSAYVEKQIENVIGVSVKDRVKEIVLDNGVPVGMRVIK